MLHRYNPKLTESQFRLGITGIGADFPSLELQPRWERVGEHAMVARLMLHCLQDLHVTLAGYREVSASSLEAMYDAVYRYLINWVPSAKTSEKRLRKYRVDRLIGFIMSEVDEKLLGRILTPEIMAASVRQLVPARQALRSYESKNPGLLQERVISSGEFIRIRLSLRSKSADGEGRTLDEARTQAQEKLADLLYDGNFPTLRDTYPQRAREDNKPNSQMVAWTKIFGISDDMTARLLFLDPRNDTLDEFIEEIGYHLGAIFYYEKVAQSFDEDETEIAAFLNRLMKTPKLSVIPSERRLGARLVTGNWVVKRLFFYLNPMDRPINKAFAQILAYERYVESPAQATDTTTHPVTEQRPVPATSIAREPSRKVTPTYAPHRSEDQAQANGVSTQESATSDSGAKTTAEVDSVKKAYQALDKSHQQPKEGAHMSEWRQLSGVAPIVEWVNQKGVPYTALLKAPLTPLSFIKQFAAAWPGANLVIAVPELTRSLMVTLAPLIRQVLATQGNVKLYAGQLKRVLTPEDHGKAVSATALLALMNLGVAFGSLDALPVGGFLELRGQRQVVDVLAASGLDAVDQTPAERLTPYQGTVAPIGMSPFAGWTAQLTDEQAPITRQALESLLFSDELSELGF